MFWVAVFLSITFLVFEARHEGVTGFKPPAHRLDDQNTKVLYTCMSLFEAADGI